MLANGITLGYATKGGSTYTNLTGLKEVPEIGNSPEKVENTCLSDSVKQYENGVGDPGDLQYKFKYDNSSAAAPFRILRSAETAKTTLTFCETLPDGTKYVFDAEPSVKLGSGAVNGALEFTVTMALQSSIAVTDPA